MNLKTRTHLDNLHSSERELLNQAYTFLMEATEQPVGWADEAWEELVGLLSHKDNKVRAIAAQVLANLARYDYQGRILDDFEALLNVTRDERFVTARHCMQSIWKVGLAGPAQQAALIEGLEQRFEECAAEKNCTLIRYDILQGMRNLYDRVQDPSLRDIALLLIGRENDLKYRKKYSSLWKSP